MLRVIVFPSDLQADYYLASLLNIGLIYVEFDIKKKYAITNRLFINLRNV